MCIRDSGIGGLIEPAALGVGYDNIRHLLAGDLVLQAVLLLLVCLLYTSRDGIRSRANGRSARA